MNNDNDVITRSFDAKARNILFTFLPAVVTNVDKYESHQYVSVKPTLNRVYKDGVEMELGEIKNVPVTLPSAGGAVLSFPVKVGDTVGIMFSKYSMDEWKQTDGKKPVSPKMRRIFHVQDAVAILGLYPSKSSMSPNPDHVELKFAGSSYLFKDNGDLEGIVAGDANITVNGSTTINSNGELNLNSAGDINISAVGAVNITGSTVNLN